MSMNSKVKCSRLCLFPKKFMGEALRSKKCFVFGLVLMGMCLHGRYNILKYSFEGYLFPKVLNEIRKTNIRRRIIRYHYNASSFTIVETTQFLAGQKIELITYQFDASYHIVNPI